MTGASSAGSITGNPLPKWQLALIVGAPVAVGLGYMYYKNTKPSPKSNRSKPKGSSKENGTLASDKQISIDADYPPTNDINTETPFEKAQRLKNEGNQHFKKGKYSEAIAQYNKAIEICPEEYKQAVATFYQNRAAAYEQLNKYSSVKADCTKALELYPTYAKALLRRAKALEHANDWEAALEDVTAACVLEQFENQSAMIMADRVLKELGKHNAMKYLESNKLIMPSKHFIKKYINTFHEDPVFNIVHSSDYSNFPAGFAKILQCVKDQEYDDIIPLCTEQINSSEEDIVPYKMELLLLRATFYLLLGQHNDAIEDFGNIINSDTVSNAMKVNALIKRAALFIQLAELDKPSSDFNMAVEINPNSIDVYHHRGQMHLVLENIKEAAEDFKKAVELKPDFAEAYVQKCYFDYRYGAMEKDVKIMMEAMKDFEEAFERFPDCSECYTVYAQILTETQEFQKADSYLAKAIEKDPNNATGYVRRGFIQLQWNGDVDKAVEYINKALEIDDKCVFAYETLGTIEVQRGNAHKAIELFDKAIALSGTALELIHIFSLKHATKTRLSIKNKLNSGIMMNI